MNWYFALDKVEKVTYIEYNPETYLHKIIITT